MEKRWQGWLAGALVVACIAVAGFMWRGSASETTGQVARVPLQDVPRPAAPTLRPPMQGVSAASVPASVLAAAANQSLSAHVANLLASHDPHDAYAAYMLVSRCAAFNRQHDLEVEDSTPGAGRGLNADERRTMTRMCGAMTERERLARLDYLATAVKAGVPGAAWMYAAEGPFGDPSALTTRPDDPLVREWKAQAASQLDAAAETGDTTALMLWGMQKLGGSALTDRRPEQGYGYLAAVGLIGAELAPPGDTSPQMFAEGRGLLAALATQLTPAQRAAAMTEARRIAAAAKARRERDHNKSGVMPAA
ncbi:hypothetical protein RCH14_003324 [Massilia sp. MP_M2]|uniref:hypothetical protein n=1 Tax=Massilia sp. MP_M2 TaxID=3071713 RepID=UPI00319E5FEC